MAINQNKKFSKGVSIIEILIIAVILTVALSSVLGLVAFSLKTSTAIKETVQANNLAQEAIEAVKNFRDGTDWPTNGIGALTTGVAYFSQKSADNPPKWQMSPGEEETASFKRKIVFDKVSRDYGSKNIETNYNPANDDQNSRKITATISWKNKKIEVITYLTNWK